MPDNPTCATCRWWEENGDAKIVKGVQRVGVCRRFPPTQALRLLIAASDWCGEHAPRVVVGVDFGAGGDRTVICVQTVAQYVSAAADHGATVEGPVSPGDSFTVGSVTWLYRPPESPDAPR